MAQRLVLGQHKQLGSDIEDIYTSYVAQVKDLGTQFYQSKIFNKIRGSWDRRMWFLHTEKNFLKYLNDDSKAGNRHKILRDYDGKKWILEDFKDPLDPSRDKELRQRQEDLFRESRINFHLRYQQYRAAYQTEVWKALSTSPVHQYDPWKQPIKMQIYVWEQWLSRNKKGLMFDEARPKELEKYLYDRDKYIEERGKSFYSELFVYDIQNYDIGQGQCLKEDNRLFCPDSKIFRKILDSLPMQTIFVPSAEILRWLVDELASIFRDILVYHIFGRELLREKNAIDGFLKLTGKDLLEEKGSYIPFKLLNMDLEIYWNLLPIRFDFQDYRAGKSPAPTALYCAMFQKEMAESHFLGLIRGENRTEYLKPVSDQLDEQIESKLSSEDINLSVIDAKRYLRRNPKGDTGQSVMIHYSTTGGYSHSGETGSLKDHNLMDKNGFFEVNELIGVLSDETGEFNRKGADLAKFLNEALDSDDEQITVSRIDAMLDLAIKQSKPIYFSYKKHGQDMLGTIYPSSVMTDKIFFFTQSQAKLRSELFNDQLFIEGISLLSIILVLILGSILSRSVVRPIVQLTNKISRMAEGKYDEQVHIKSNDEIGQLADRFNQMAEVIKDKLFQMRAVGIVNLMMNHELPRRVMLKYILHLLCIKYNASHGFIGFFDGGLSSNSSAYPQWKNSQTDVDLEVNFLPKILDQLYPQKSSLIILQQSQLIKLGLPFNNAISFYTAPSLDGEEVKDSVDHVNVHGMLFLANIDNSFLEVFRDEVQQFKNPIYNLCNQAKTVVVKTLLDEIEGDTRRGQEIQEGLMPPVDLQFRGCLDVAYYFKGARGLAGDYFDVQSSADGQTVHFSIVDVSGKGIGPALFGAKSRAFMRVLTDRYSCQSGLILEQLNQNLCLNKRDSLFLTMFHCSVDLTNLNFFYGSAGHNKMFLIKTDGNLIHLNSKGIPIGLFSPSIYATEEIKLQIGDLIVLYTDGVTELENDAKELYGQETFEEFCIQNRNLTATEFAKTLNRDLDEFRKGILPSDDITYVIFRILRKVSDKQ